jgi:hypothetical protein
MDGEEEKKKERKMRRKRREMKKTDLLILDSFHGTVLHISYTKIAALVVTIHVGIICNFRFRE